MQLKFMEASHGVGAGALSSHYTTQLPDSLWFGACPLLLCGYTHLPMV